MAISSVIEIDNGKIDNDAEKKKKALLMKWFQKGNINIKNISSGMSIQWSKAGRGFMKAIKYLSTSEGDDVQTIVSM